MAEALLARRLAGRCAVGSVRSAGIQAAGIQGAGLPGEGERPPAEAISAMATYGLDTGSHRSRQLTVADLVRANLVIGMARAHVRQAVVTLPEVWPRAFTLKEIVRRGEAIGARQAGGPLSRCGGSGGARAPGGKWAGGGRRWGQGKPGSRCPYGCTAPTTPGTAD